VQSLQLNKQSRDESERAVKQMKRLFERLETLEQKEDERKKYDEIKAEIEQAFRKEEEEHKAAEENTIVQEVKMNEDPNTTREVHFKLDSDSDQVSDSSSSDSSDSSDISKDKATKK
jgi:hypothetical protein